MSAVAQQISEIKIKLSVVKGPHLGKVFQLSKTTFTIGRGPENDVVLMDDPLISRSHARVTLVDRDLEISNLSNKNAILVDGERVHKWKIINNTNFIVGDSEIRVEYDLGPVALVSPSKPAPVLQLKPNIKASGAVIPAPPVAKPKLKPNSTIQGQGQGQGQSQSQLRPVNKNAAPPSHPSQAINRPISPNPNFKIYLLLAIAIGGLYLYWQAQNKNLQVKKITSTLRYEDEVNTKMVSQKEIDKEAEREALSTERAKSPQAFRIDENFVRGMRDYQLGNYTRAQEFFQLILNLDPDHILAKRYVYLSKVRFDELVQEKLMLGESYFKKHNFRMCESLYRQVTDMLNGKNNDQKFLLASKKARECELAAEGIR